MVIEARTTEDWQLCRVVDHDWHHGGVPVPQDMKAHLEQAASKHVGVVVQLFYLLSNSIREVIQINTKNDIFPRINSSCNA